MLLAACALAGLVALLLHPGNPADRLTGHPTSPRVWLPRRWAGADPQAVRGAPGVVAAAAAAGALVGFGVLPALSAGLLGGVLTRRLLSAWVDRRADAERRSAVDACNVVADELRSGRAPQDALRIAADSGQGLLAHTLRRAASTAALGGNVAGSLREVDPAAPVAATLRQLAVCWQVSERTGSGLAVAAAALADALVTDAQQRRDVTAELAGPRATARLLAGLPVFGIALGSALGAAPLDVLLHSTLGGGLLLAGTALNLAGLAWTDAVLRRACRADG